MNLLDNNLEVNNKSITAGSQLQVSRKLSCKQKKIWFHYYSFDRLKIEVTCVYLSHLGCWPSSFGFEAVWRPASVWTLVF